MLKFKASSPNPVALFPNPNIDAIPDNPLVTLTPDSGDNITSTL
jgi:hypothetical protein